MVTLETVEKSWNRPMASVWMKLLRMVLCWMSRGWSSPLVVTPLMWSPVVMPGW